MNSSKAATASCRKCQATAAFLLRESVLPLLRALLASSKQCTVNTEPVFVKTWTDQSSRSVSSGKRAPAKYPKNAEPHKAAAPII